MSPWKFCLITSALWSCSTPLPQDALADEPRYSNDVESPPFAHDHDHAHRHDFGTCYASCDELRENCIRDFYRRFGDWHSRRHHSWEELHGHDVYRHCERRFDICINGCRDTRWWDR